jgi:hypothetical protein
MTDATPTTSACRDEGRTALSPVEGAFLRLSRSLDRCITAERHLLQVDADGFDSARTACEAAGDILTALLGQILALPETAPADRSLRQLAFILNSVLSIESDGDRGFFAVSLLHHARLFEAWDPQPTDPMIPGLERHCLAKIARLIELRDTITAESTPEASGPGIAA